MHHVVIDALALVLLVFFFHAVIDTEQVVSKGRNHEELLHHAVHVANAAKVSETDILLVSLLGSLGHVVPVLRLLDGLDEWYKLSLEEALHESCTVLDHHVKELVGCLTALVVRG